MTESQRFFDKLHQKIRKGCLNMRKQIGDRVCHPIHERSGEVTAIHQNPACLMRTLVVKWDDGEVEEIEELEFGPLED